MWCLDIRGWLIIIQPFGKYYVHACIRARACGFQTLIGHMYIRVCNRLGISAFLSTLRLIERTVNSHRRYPCSSTSRNTRYRAFVDWEFAREWEIVLAFPWTFDKRVTFRLRFIAFRILDILKVDTNEYTRIVDYWYLLINFNLT